MDSEKFSDQWILLSIIDYNLLDNHCRLSGVIQLFHVWFGLIFWAKSNFLKCTVGFDYIFTNNDFIVSYFNDRDDKQVN